MRHIPNLLSLIRIALIPAYLWVLSQGKTLEAGVILALSGLTDLVDGKLARRFGWVSQLGKVLDPIADKLTQVAVSLSLMLQLRGYWPFFAVMILKDVVMLALGGQLIAKGAKLEGAKWLGKLATFVYYGTMVAILLLPAMPGWIRIALLAGAAVCSILAAVSYLPEYRRYRRGAASACGPGEGEQG